MSELAFNMNGEAFEVPANASGWRVRRMKVKGAPEVVYGRNGVPLVLPLESDIDDVRREVEGVPGRYRLDPVDENQRPVRDAPAGYVYVHTESRALDPMIKPTMPPPTTESIVLVEAMRMNAEMARSVIDRFPMMMEAAATLLRAADGAGLPARPGMATDDSDDDEPTAASPGGFDLNSMIAQLVPALMTGFMSGKAKLPDVGELLDWRRAARKATGEAPATAADDATSTTAATPAVDVAAQGVEPMIPPLDPATMAHFLAVRSTLSAEESVLAGEVARQLSAAQLRAWFDELRPLSVTEAAERVRALIGMHRKPGGAS